jgi:hypothetical protein
MRVFAAALHPKKHADDARLPAFNVTVNYRNQDQLFQNNYRAKSRNASV